MARKTGKWTRLCSLPPMLRSRGYQYANGLPGLALEGRGRPRARPAPRPRMDVVEERVGEARRPGPAAATNGRSDEVRRVERRIRDRLDHPARVERERRAEPPSLPGARPVVEPVEDRGKFPAVLGGDDGQAIDRGPRGSGPSSLPIRTGGTTGPGRDGSPRRGRSGRRPARRTPGGRTSRPVGPEELRRPPAGPRRPVAPRGGRTASGPGRTRAGRAVPWPRRAAARSASARPRRSPGRRAGAGTPSPATSSRSEPVNCSAAGRSTTATPFGSRPRVSRRPAPGRRASPRGHGRGPT